MSDYRALRDAAVREHYERGYRAGIEAAARVCDDMMVQRINTIGNRLGDPVEWLREARTRIYILSAPAAPKEEE